MIFLQIAAILLGTSIVFSTIIGAIRTFVVPRAESVKLTRLIFLVSRRIFDMMANRHEKYEDRDRILALYAPITLVAMPAVWLFMVMIGYMLIFWGIGVRPLYRAFSLSGSSLLTLGFTPVDNLAQTALAFSEATIGLGLVALLIAYLPTMYTAFSRRESFVGKLEVRAGTPASPVEMISRLYRIGRIGHMEELWIQWEDWFTELEETHTSLAALNFFRSSHSDRSWLTAAGAILDGTAFFRTTVDLPSTAQADLCIRAGYIALRRIADFFQINYSTYSAAPDVETPISITRRQFDAACENLAAYGVPLKPDRDLAWKSFHGWRINYDVVLSRLMDLIVAPPIGWPDVEDDVS